MNFNLNKNNGYSPNIIREIYNIQFPKIDNDSILPDICIIAVSSFDIQSSFNIWLNYYNLPINNLNIYSLDNKPFINNPRWNNEAILDVCAAYISCPYANIHVIFAVSESFEDLIDAIIKANKILDNNGGIVSMSFGTNNGMDDIFLEEYFIDKNIVYIASSGDNGLISYPSTSFNVISVGGTSLYITNESQIIKRKSETIWNKQGHGISTNFSKPIYQNNLQKYNDKKNRYIPDLCCIAHPGINVYSPYIKNSENIGSFKVSIGTSLSAPLFAGCIAHANFLRLNNNKKCLTSINDNYNNVLINISLLYNNNYKIFSEIFYNSKDIDNIHSGFGIPNFNLLANYLFLI